MNIHKVYVAAPSNKGNGGGESLHQFVDVCIRNGIDAYIYYFDKRGELRTIIPSMEKYNIQVATEIDDVEENLLIFPEVRTEELRKYKKIRKCIWWLSLEFYFRSHPVYRGRLYLKKRGFPLILLPLAAVAASMFASASFRIFRFNSKNQRIHYFLYNCEYAHEYIVKNCNYKYYAQYLCGPLNEIYFRDDFVVQKQNLIVYSSKKSNGFVEKIIEEIQKKDKSIEICCIKNMTQEEVKDVFSRAAVYLDFGFFPGPERLPREAVMMRCNIITSKIGSAENEIDVPIDKKYKYDMKDEKLPEIRDLALDMVYNYPKYVKDFEQYRSKVITQKENFEKDVIKFLERVK